MKLKVLLLLILACSIGSQETFSENTPNPNKGGNNNDSQQWGVDDDFIIYKDSDQIGPTSISIPGGIQLNEPVIKIFGKGTIWSAEDERKLELEFYYEFNNITLVLESNNSVLYSIAISVKAGDTLDIDITTLPSGAYTLRGLTTNQTTFKGEFTL